MKRDIQKWLRFGAAVVGLAVTPCFFGCPAAPPQARKTPAPAKQPTTPSIDAGEKKPADPSANTEKVAEPTPNTTAPETKPAVVEEKKPVETTPATPPADPATPAKTDDVKPADPDKPAEPAKPDEPAAGEEKPLPARAAVTTAAKPDKAANAPVKEGDWNQWGGTSHRNNIPIAKNVPTDWDPGKFDRKTGEWMQDGKNIKWVAAVGSQTYGNPVVASGRVLVGTNNEAGYLKRYPKETDLGVLVCFDEKSGDFLWQHSCEKLPTGRVHDWPQQGICAAPYVEGNRAWVVTSRGEVVCVDVNGFHDGKDDGDQNLPAKLFEIMKAEDPAMDKVAGMIAALNEGKLTDDLRKNFTEAGMELPAEVTVKVDDAGKKWSFDAKVAEADRKLFLTLQGPRLMGFKVLSPADKDESDVIWTFDMMKELGSSQHNMCSTSITCLGDILFVCTGNGVDESHINIPAPKAASFFAIDKNTKQVYWTDNTPGENIIHGQWSSPAVAELGGVWQVIFGGGDGWLYSFKADKGKDGKPELLWKFDLNPKEARWVLGGRGTRNEPIGTPVIYDGLVYIAVGQDPEHGEGVGHIYCIDPTKRGDVSEFLVVKRADPKVTAPARRLVGVLPEEGEVVIPNEANTACVWHYSEEDKNGDKDLSFDEQMHRTIGTCAIKDDLCYIADFSGLFHCFDAKTGKELWQHDMLGASWGSPLIADGKVFIGDEDGDLFVFKHDKVKKLLSAAEGSEDDTKISMGNAIYSTPTFANGVLFIANKTHVFAIANEGPAVAAKGDK